MDEVLRIKWGILMLNTRFVKGGIYSRSIGGSFSNFERALKISSPNSVFRNWLKELIDEGVLIFFEEKKGIGGTTKNYMVDRKKMDNYLRSFPMYDLFYHYFVSKSPLPIH